MKFGTLSIDCSEIGLVRPGAALLEISYHAIGSQDGLDEI